MILDKIKAVYEVANKLWHDDWYDFDLRCLPSKWVLHVTQKQQPGRGSMSPGPVSPHVVFDKEITEETVDAVLRDLHTSIIKRATELADFRKADCDRSYAEFKKVTDAFTQQLFILSEAKKLIETATPVAPPTVPTQG